MTYIIIIAILAVIFYFSRNKIKELVLKFRDKKGIGNKISEVEKDLVYSPVLSSRTFYLAITVDEVGEGKATFTIVKNPKL